VFVCGNHTITSLSDRLWLSSFTHKFPWFFHLQLPWWGEMVPTFGSWLTTTAKVLTARQNLPAMAALTSSSASMGVVTGGAANPADCFSYYVVFITAIASLIFSLRNI
jgi:hypothetical protein